MERTTNENVVRRRRKVGRTVREKTPEPNLVQMARKYSDEDSSLLEGTTASEEGVMGSLRIRPPGPKSAHQSKILQRRDKTFATAAARSHSQPREAERITSPEADNLIRIVKRSLSSSSHRPKEESSENEAAPQRRGEMFTASPLVENGNLSRLEQNLRRFEEERKRFEVEKRQFEKEKREHKTRYKTLFDNDDKKRLIQTYRKASFNRQGDGHRSRDGNTTPLMVRKPSNYEESSTQFSSSDADTAEEMNLKRLAKTLSPVRRHESCVSDSAHYASVRGPPPEPPSKGISRKQSLSPIKPERRSRTPEERQEMLKKALEHGNGNAGAAVKERKTSLTVPLDSPQGFQEERRASNEATKQEVRKRSMEKALLPPKEEERPENLAPVKPFFIRFLVKLFEKKAPPEKEEDLKQIPSEEPSSVEPSPEKIMSRAFLQQFLKEARLQWIQLKRDYPSQVAELKRMQRKCFLYMIMLIMLCGFGGLMFRYTEGTSENIYKCEVRKVKRDFIDNLWSASHNTREDDWKSLARNKLRKFEEELHALQVLGVRRSPGMKSWNFVNCILYCWTVVTTIGYGHITPKTSLGQSLTIIYAIIGIPMFLILLADFGKLFTRALKFLWAYVRRCYYNGTCRRIRKQQQVRDAMTGFNTVYEAAMRRQSKFFGMGPDTDLESQTSGVNLSHPETPTSPYPETYEVDDEFNLPVSVASILLISYILIGAFVYTLWEDWTYFEAFYFVFISMSTIGFGDFVPNHPIFMMCSIIYLVFGLALTSMFINVVQIKLSDTFKQASAKLGATIGFGEGSELDDEMGSHIRTPSEIASVHGSRLDKIAEVENENSLRPPPSGSPFPSILRQNRPDSPVSSNTDLNGHAVPPMPRRQVSMEEPAEVAKKKNRFFK